MLNGVHDGSGFDVLPRETSQGFTARRAFPRLSKRSVSAVLEGYQRGVADWSLTFDEILFLAPFAHPVRKMPLRYGVDFKISRELFGRDSFGIVGEMMHYEQPYLTAKDGDLHHGAGLHRQTPATPAAMARRVEVFHAD